MIKHPRVWMYVLAIILLASMAIIVLVKPLWGIDFTGGSLLEISTNTTAPADIRAALQAASDREVSVQSTQDGTMIIRTAPLSEEEHQSVLDTLKESNLMTEELRFESIGPTIGAELRQKAWMAVGLSIIGMIAYLAYAFRQSNGLVSSWKFGVAAVVALIHDLLVTTAVFVVVGHFTGASIDTMFITAMLAILGYSVNDTIIIFNRMCQEWILDRSANLPELMDRAARATLIRSLNTSLTTLLTLTALLLLGGTTIRWFVIALITGIIAGTYSSIFVAPPVLDLLARRPAR